MINERNAYIQFLISKGLCPEGRARACVTINNSDIKAHGKNIPFSYIPLIVNEQDLSFFDREIEKAHSILNKITHRYVEDSNYRKIFGFSKEMEKLICLPCNYDEPIPVGRYDLFLDEVTGDYQFCEFNTDGSGGMSRDTKMSQSIISSFDESFIDSESGEVKLVIPAQDFELKQYVLSPMDVTSSIVDKFIDVYQSTPHAKSKPTFCVTDFTEEGVMSDFNHFIETFKKRGFNARFTDICNLQFDGDVLRDVTDGHVIDVIYRRAVTSVILEHLEECQGLIQAVEAGAVTLLGHFRTSIAHSKVIFEAMHHLLTQDFLTKDEIEYINAHVPFTIKFRDTFVSEDLLGDVITNKDNWVIKPQEGFGSHGVVCGCDFDHDEWTAVVNSRLNGNDVLQRFCTRFNVPLLGPTDACISDYPLMYGIYQACGHAVGLYSRAGNNGLIDFEHEGIYVSTVFSSVI